MEGTFNLGSFEFIREVVQKCRTDNDQAEGLYEDHRSGLAFSYTSERRSIDSAARGATRTHIRENRMTTLGLINTFSSTIETNE